MSFKSLMWKDRLSQWKLAREALLRGAGKHTSGTKEPDAGDADDFKLLLSETDNNDRGMLSRKVAVSPSKIHPYRFSIIAYLIVLFLFLRFRFSHPVNNAYGLWVVSVFSEAWLSVFSFLDKLTKWQPVNRETYPEQLSMRYNEPGKPSSLPSVDVFICLSDYQDVSPLVMSNTILSILSIDYPAEKVSCYISDDGASLLTLKTLIKTTEFAKRWVPFCKKFNIEPRSPESYFSMKVDSARFSIYPTFPKERRLIKRKYEEFKGHISDIVATFQNAPNEGWMMKDGTPWPGNDVSNHPSMIQIIIGHGGGSANYDNESLPQLIYVARERQPGLQHNDKPGALNALVRVSTILSNGVYILNLDCNQYINNSKVFLEAMCFMMDTSNDKICFVQFPQQFDCIGAHDQHPNKKTVFYDTILKCLDGIQGPTNMGTCCFFFRKALCGHHPPFDPKMLRRSCESRKRGSSGEGNVFSSELNSFQGRPSSSSVEEINKLGRESSMNMENYSGHSTISTASNIVSDDRFSWSISTDEILREAIRVTSCDYEDNTAWGKEVGWMYGLQASDVLTGLKMHVCGWRSVYYMPICAAFRVYTSVNLTHQLREVLLSAIGSVETLFSKHCPIWYGYGGRLKLLERVAYINATVYPFTSIPLLIYSILPAICLFSGKFILPITYQAIGWLILFVLAFILNGLSEIRWSGVSVKECWRNQQFWFIAGLSSHLLAIVKACGSMILCCRSSRSMRYGDGEDNLEFYAFKSSLLLFLPTTLIFINLLAMVVGIFSVFAHGYGSLGQLVVNLFYAIVIVFHLHPFLKALLHRKQIPVLVLLWSVLLAILISVLWLQVDPFTVRFKGPDVHACGIEC